VTLTKPNMNQLSLHRNYVVGQCHILAMILQWGHFIFNQHKVVQEEQQ